MTVEKSVEYSRNDGLSDESGYMTAQWKTCNDPEQMLALIQNRADEGRLRLFACGCCRRIWHLIEPQNRAVVEAAENFVRGNLTRDELQAAADSVTGGGEDLEQIARGDARVSAHYEATTAAWQSAALPAADAAWFAARCAAAAVADLHWPDPSSPSWKQTERAERAAQADLLRAIFRRVPSAGADARLSTAGRPG